MLYIFRASGLPPSIAPQLRKVLRYLIEKEGVQTFYVGHQGHFDSLVYTVLQELEAEYSQISFFVVLSHWPEDENTLDLSHCIYITDIESIEQKQAITFRNQRMLEWSDLVVSYVTHTSGSAAHYAALACQMGKRIIKIES